MKFMLILVFLYSRSAVTIPLPDEAACRTAANEAVAYWGRHLNGAQCIEVATGKALK